MAASLKMRSSWGRPEFQRSSRAARKGKSKSSVLLIASKKWGRLRVSIQGVESLWGDCRFIPADWGS